MFDYLQKFNSLPKDLRDSVSSPVAMGVISDLEKKYKLDLAATVMKIMVKIIPLTDLPIYLVSDFSLDQESAKILTAELKERLFFSVANYLGYNPSYLKVVPKTTIQPPHLVGVDKVIKDSGIVFPGSELNARFRNILATYIKGVRSRIDTRLTLSKEISAGGLSLDNKIIDQIFKSADEIIAGHTLTSGTISSPLLPKAEEPKTGLEKVRALYEKEEEKRDIPYDLKSAILSGAIKKPSAPLNLPTPKEANEKLLEEPEEQLKLSPVVPVLKKEEIIVEHKIEKTAVKVEEKKIVVNPITPVNKTITPVVEKKEEKVIAVSQVKVAPIITSPVAIKVATEVATSANKFIPVATASTTAKINSQAPAIQQSVSPENKIVRPPEKKASFFSKIFHPENNNHVIPVPPIKPVSQAVTPVIPVITKEPEKLIVKPSIVSLRNEAASNPLPKAPLKVAEKTIIPNQDSANVVPRVMGPIEEISYLDLVNFRRLGMNPKEAISKVEMKIKNLEKDGYDKMVLGVVAWRNSIINSIYLKMAQESLNKELTLKQLADNYKEEKKGGFLFWEEIEEIISLNNRLMF